MATTNTEIARLSTITAHDRAVEINAASIARAEASGSILFGTLVEDQDFWARTGVVTGLDLERELTAGEISDSFKERTGIRPRHWNFSEMTLNELEEVLERELQLWREEREWREAEEAFKQQDEDFFWAQQDALDKSAAERAEKAAVEAAEDAVWAIQDELETGRPSVW